MTPVAATWLPYRLRLRRPWVTTAGTLQERHGRLLRLVDAVGRSGWGDCAPLALAGIDAAMAERFAEECARLDLAAQAARLPLANWLAGQTTPARIPVNAALGDIGTVTEGALAAAVAAGFATIKIKVGNAPPDRELQYLQALCRQLPAGCRLRLDANRAWDEATAHRFLSGCANLPVEAIEEPLRQPTLKTLAHLQANTGITLALDESLPGFALADVFDRQPVRRLVLKPARQGGLVATLTLARQARAAGLECIVTSSLESACGLAALAHLAAAIAPEQAHGLATANWLASDTGAAPTIIDGHLLLPAGPGIGFVPSLS